MKKLLILFSLILLFSCNSNTPISDKTSDLKGVFVNNEVIDAKFKKQYQDGYYLYSTLYPQSINMVDDQAIAYRIDQRLKLNKDYTYNYEYSIVLGSSDAWGSLQVSKINVLMNGIFNYKEKEENKYIVNLSNPISGNEQMYGCYLKNFSSFKENEIHPEADYVLDFSALSKIEDYQFDKYACSRSVLVNIAQEEKEDNLVEDNLFFSSILDDLGHFNTY